MKTALSGPLIVYGSRSPLGTGAGGASNPDRAPSLIWGGVGIMDPRASYNRTKAGAVGFSTTAEIPVIDAVPSTISAVNIAASQSPAAGAITLVSATGAGITVLAAATVIVPSMNTIPVGALAIDGAPGLVSFGLASVSNGFTAVSMYDPTKTLARNVRLTSGGNDSGITFTVSGYDIYGYPMSEAITGANAGVASGKKAFKFITGVTHTGSVAGTLTIGTGDVYGLPIRVDTIGYLSLVWNLSMVTANTGWLTADATTPATTTTGDVRGTYAVQSASDGTKRLQAYVTPSLANLANTSPVIGLFGVAQV